MNTSYLINKYVTAIVITDYEITQRLYQRLMLTAFGCYNRLKSSKEGKTALSELISHKNPKVRLWASAHSLDWCPSEALYQLDKLGRSHRELAVPARILISAYESGFLERN